MTIFNNKYAVGGYPTTTGYKYATIIIDNINYPVVVTAYSLTKQEKIQIIESFADSFHIYPFGKKPDVLALAGHLLSETGDATAGKDIESPYVDKIRAFSSAKSGELVKVSGPGDMMFTGIAENIRIDATSNTPALMSFNMTLREVDNPLTAIPFSGNSKKKVSSAVGSLNNQVAANRTGVR